MTLGIITIGGAATSFGYHVVVTIGAAARLLEGIPIEPFGGVIRI
jgi:hypothetical protein